jgi:hypothetical protein
MGMPPVATAAGNGRCTTEQRGKIRELTTQVFADKATEQQTAWLKGLGLSAASSLTAEQAASRITYLAARVPGMEAGVSPESSPF